MKRSSSGRRPDCELHKRGQRRNSRLQYETQQKREVCKLQINNGKRKRRDGLSRAFRGAYTHLPHRPHARANHSPLANSDAFTIPPLLCPSDGRERARARAPPRRLFEARVEAARAQLYHASALLLQDRIHPSAPLPPWWRPGCCTVGGRTCRFPSDVDSATCSLSSPLCAALAGGLPCCDRDRTSTETASTRASIPRACRVLTFHLSDS